MTRFLLDTNVISQAVKNPGGSVDLNLRSHIGEDIGTSLVVKAELLFGVRRNPAMRGRDRLEALLDALEIWSLEPPVEERYAVLRAGLADQGKPIGPNDLWIAAHALALDAVLVTDNEKEFSRVPELKIENWARDVRAEVR